MRCLKGMSSQTIIFLLAAMTFLPGQLLCQEKHGSGSREDIDRMRDRDLQPEKILDVIKLREGMKAGEAGASYGYFTFKMSRRVGNKGIVYANDIDKNALTQIEERSNAENIANIKTVLGAVEDPLFPEKDLDMVVVFDCLFEFSQPARWMRNARNYLKPGGRLVVVDPDPAKIGSSEHFLSRKQVLDFAAASGFEPISVDDSFLKSHMILILQPIEQRITKGFGGQTPFEAGSQETKSPISEMTGFSRAGGPPRDGRGSGSGRGCSAGSGS